MHSSGRTLLFEANKMLAFLIFAACLAPSMHAATNVPPPEADFDVNSFFTDYDPTLDPVHYSSTSYHTDRLYNYDPAMADNAYDSYIDEGESSASHALEASSSPPDGDTITQLRLDAMMKELEHTLHNEETGEEILKHQWFHQLIEADQQWLVDMMGHYWGGRVKKNKLWLRYRVMDTLRPEKAMSLLNGQASIQEIVQIANRTKIGAENPYQESLRDVSHTLEAEGMKKRTATRYMAEAKQDPKLKGRAAPVLYHAIVKKWNKCNYRRSMKVKEYQYWTPARAEGSLQPIHQDQSSEDYSLRL